MSVLAPLILITTETRRHRGKVNGNLDFGFVQSVFIYVYLWQKSLNHPALRLKSFHFEIPFRSYNFVPIAF
jgi:hypothetical protein